MPVRGSGRSKAIRGGRLPLRPGGAESSLRGAGSVRGPERCGKSSPKRHSGQGLQLLDPSVLSVVATCRQQWAERAGVPDDLSLFVVDNDQVDPYVCGGAALSVKVSGRFSNIAIDRA